MTNCPSETTNLTSASGDFTTWLSNDGYGATVCACGVERTDQPLDHHNSQRSFGGLAWTQGFLSAQRARLQAAREA